MAYPVVVDGSLLGFFRMGEFAKGERDSASLKKIKIKVASLDVGNRELKKSINELPFFSSDKVAIVNNLFIMMINEISNYLKETMKEGEDAAQIEQHRRNGFISKDRAVLDIIKQIQMIAASDSSVIIYGESGTGKELLSKLSKQPWPLSYRSEETLKRYLRC